MFRLKQIFSGRITRLLLLGLFSVIVVACRPQAAAVLPTQIPTLTPVPKSTPLPALPTIVPVGKTDNPLHLVVHPDTKPNSDIIVSDLEAAITKKTELVVKIDIVDSDAAALAALCLANQPSLALVSGLGFIAANAKKCGQAQLLVSRGTGSSAATGQITTLIARRGIDALSSVKGRTYCRISNTDLVSWIIPSLMMRAAGVDPEKDPKAIKDFAEVADLVSAVASSTCDIAAIPDSLVSKMVTDDKTVSAKVTTLSSSVEFPYAVLVASSDIPLSALTALNNELISLSRDRQLKANLTQLFGQSSLVVVKADDLQPLLDFAASTKQDFVRLGS